MTLALITLVLSHVQLSSISGSSASMLVVLSRDCCCPVVSCVAPCHIIRFYSCRCTCAVYNLSRGICRRVIFDPVVNTFIRKSLAPPSFFLIVVFAYNIDKLHVCRWRLEDEAVQIFVQCQAEWGVKFLF